MALSKAAKELIRRYPEHRALLEKAAEDIPNLDQLRDQASKAYALRAQGYVPGKTGLPQAAEPRSALPAGYSGQPSKPPSYTSPLTPFGGPAIGAYVENPASFMPQPYPYKDFGDFTNKATAEAAQKGLPTPSAMQLAEEYHNQIAAVDKANEFRNWAAQAAARYEELAQKNPSRAAEFQDAYRQQVQTEATSRGLMPPQAKPSPKPSTPEPAATGVSKQSPQQYLPRLNEQSATLGPAQAKPPGQQRTPATDNPSSPTSILNPGKAESPTHRPAEATSTSPQTAESDAYGPLTRALMDRNLIGGTRQSPVVGPQPEQPAAPTQQQAESKYPGPNTFGPGAAAREDANATVAESATQKPQAKGTLMSQLQDAVGEATAPTGGVQVIKPQKLLSDVSAEGYRPTTAAGQQAAKWNAIRQNPEYKARVATNQAANQAGGFWWQNKGGPKDVALNPVNIGGSPTPAPAPTPTTSVAKAPAPKLNIKAS